MKAPTEQQLNDPKWWDENAPYNSKKVGVAYIRGELWSHEFMLPGTTAIGAPCNAEVRFFSRPAKPEPKEWDGEGWPPVGRECEWSDAGRPHIRVLVMGYYGESVWLRTVECQSPLTVHANYDSFRPIRTQVERDREDAISKALNVALHPADDEVHPRQYLTDALHALYDAGLLHKGAE